MTQNIPPANSEPLILFHVKWIAKIALSVGTVAWVGLLLAIFLVADDTGRNYANVIHTHSLTRQNLGPTILVFGLAMVVIASLATWFIALYSSFRIAGPLFRFSQNLKAIIEDAFAVPMAIRRTDMLQREWNEFDASQTALREHYSDLRNALDQCEQALQGTDLAALHHAVARMREVDRRAQF